MSAKAVVKQVIASMSRHAHLRLAELMVPRVLADGLRRELGLGPDDPLEVDGTKVVTMSERQEVLARAVDYARVRWRRMIPMSDMETIFKAVPDAELRELVPIIVAQVFDERDIPDPVDDMEHHEVEDMKAELEEVGIVDPSL